MAQNSIPKTSTILYSMTKGISEIYQLESNDSLKSFTGIKVQSYIHSYSFIHSLMSENDKNVLSIVCDFHRK